MKPHHDYQTYLEEGPARQADTLMGYLLIFCSTIPVRNGAAVVRTLLDLRDYQVR